MRMKGSEFCRLEPSFRAGAATALPPEAPIGGVPSGDFKPLVRWQLPRLRQGTLASPVFRAGCSGCDASLVQILIWCAAVQHDVLWSKLLLN